MPFLYYGDEIGLRYRNLPTKEGGYVRTGTRTPSSGTRAPTSASPRPTPTTCTSRSTPAPDAPTVEAQQADDGSLYHWVRTVLSLRETHAALQADAAFDVAAAPEHGRLFAYARTSRDGSDRLVIALNPGLGTESFPAAGCGDGLKHAI